MSIWNYCRSGASLKALQAFAVAVVSAVILVLATPPAYANHPGGPTTTLNVQPVFVSGNPTCSSLGSEFIEYKIDGVSSGIFTAPDGTKFTLTVYSTAQGQAFDWSVTGGVVKDMVVKGGPNANHYIYDPPHTNAVADTFLHSPVNHNNNRFYGLSHISFCYEPGAPSIDITKVCDSTDLSGMTASYNYTATITNDGDFPLTSIMLKEANNGFDSCVITSLNGVPVAHQNLTLGSFVAVNGVGTLDPGDHVDVGITCTAGEINLVNEIHVEGSHEGDTVTDMDSAACLFAPDPMVSVDKTCPFDDSVRLMSMDNMLVVEVCPAITVTNTGSETLSSVFVNDPALPQLAALGDLGPLAPGNSIVLDEYCYLPAAPEGATLDEFMAVVADPIDPIEGTDDKYATATAAFFNKVTVDALGFFGGTASDSDSTYFWDEEKGEWVAECPLCVPCPDCPE
ncbi:hypothetical protein [Zobellella sp. DQSA1]|uniref:hypothetical protein n=1 Tax=Zobellella sp. DQSA1 TaxID=3342386 RepID=UPI0035BFE2CC